MFVVPIKFWDLDKTYVPVYMQLLLDITLQSREAPRECPVMQFGLEIGPVMCHGAYALWESKKLKPMGMFPQIFKLLLLESTCEIFKFLQISQILT